MRKFSIWLLAAGLIVFSSAYADRPGGVAILDFDTGSNVAPVARFGTQRIAVVRSAGGWRAFVGLHPKLIPGDYIVSIKAEDVEFSRTFRVRSPVAAAEEEAPPECADITADVAWRDGSLGATYLEVPLPLVTSRLKRQAEIIGSGTWLSMDKATDIRSPAGGTVARTEPPGNSSVALVIDHGQGVASLLCPVLNPLVTLDQRVTRGQSLGTLAGNGRVWWSAIVNGQRVNPLVMTYARAQ